MYLYLSVYLYLTYSAAEAGTSETGICTDENKQTNKQKPTTKNKSKPQKKLTLFKQRARKGAAEQSRELIDNNHSFPAKHNIKPCTPFPAARPAKVKWGFLTPTQPGMSFSSSLLGGQDLYPL
jgi:hypothetical protein